MEPTTIVAWVAALRDAGFLGVTIAALIAGARGWYIWKWQHDQIVKLYESRMADYEKRLEDIVKERDRWMATSIRGAILAEKATDVHEEVYEIVRNQQDSPARRRIKEPS